MFRYAALPEFACLARYVERRVSAMKIVVISLSFAVFVSTAFAQGRIEKTPNPLIAADQYFGTRL
jgi:hypothetical protein